MPELFGSSIILPVIVVVVLLAAILGLLVLRRKTSEGTGANATAETLAPAPNQSRESRKEAALAKKAAAEQAAATEATAQEAALEQPTPGVTPALAAVAVPEQAGVTPTTPETASGVSAGAAGLVGGPATPASPQAPSDVFAPQEQPAPSGSHLERKRPDRDEGLVLSGVGVASVDPLQAVIDSVLRGWGDVTDEDTNRLAVFRKDKLIAALAAAEIPRELKNSESAKTRLVQLRRFAGAMDEHRSAPHGSTEHEFAGMIVGAPAAAAAPPAPTPAVAPAARRPFSYGVEENAPPAPAAAETESAPAATAPPATPAPAAIPSPDRSHAFAVPEDAMESWDIPSPKPSDKESTPSRKDHWDFDSGGPGEESAAEESAAEESAAEESAAEESAAEERAAEFEWGEAPKEAPPEAADLKPAGFTWGTTPIAQSESPSQTAAAGAALAGWTLPTTEPAATKAAATEPVAAPASEATTPTEPQPVAGADDARRSAEAAVAAAAAAFWTTSDASTLEVEAAQTPPPTKKETDPFAGLGAKVSTAADIMALPAPERPDMLAFLEPSELAKVFGQAQDKDLKRAVIDTLEHVGNTSSLDALRQCLEDADPEVQLYALDAADRMLGNS